MKKYIEDNSKILNFQYQKSIKELSIFFKKNGLDAMEMEYIIQQIKAHLLKKPNFFQEVRKINTSNAVNNSLLKYALYDEHSRIPITIIFDKDIMVHISFGAYNEVLKQIEDFIYFSFEDINESVLFLNSLLAFVKKKEK